MQRERVAEDVFVFISDMYVEVTAGVIFTEVGSIVVDTLPFPQETRQLREFALSRGGPVRYVINTHFHADHVYGTYLFKGATVIAHERCRQLLKRFGENSLRQAKLETPELAEVELCLPSVVFNGELTLRLGGKSVQLMLMPGHTADSIVAYVKEDKILFAGDAVMPVPYIVWGDPDDMLRSFQAMMSLNIENLVQGHGDVLLRGEVQETLKTGITYLQEIKRRVREVVETGQPPEALRRISIEACGKSRIPLGGLVSRLHQANLEALYRRYMAERRRPGLSS